MPSKSAVPTVATLRSLLMQIGSSASANKDVLVSRLSKDLLRPKITGPEDRKKSTRILSIDMGIRNLAFCVADVKMGTLDEKEGHSPVAQMKIQAWRRLDVGDEMMRLASRDSTPDTVLPSVDDEDAADPYAPPTLSKTAYTLLSQTLLPYKPDVILLERQRWRSSSGPSIQQWTVRVNTLEGMLWAILTSLREEAKKETGTSVLGERNYQLFGVYPKRVGQYWIGSGLQDEVSSKIKRTSRKVKNEVVLGADGEVEESVDSSMEMKKIGRKLSRAKIEKSAKIKILRSWLTPGVLSTTLDTSSTSTQAPMEFKFSPEAEATREGLCATLRERKSGRKLGQSPSMIKELRKLDDVTDCFLQVAAWVAWEENRKRISACWNSERGEFIVPYSEDSDKVRTDSKSKNVAKVRKGTAKSPKKKEIMDDEAP